MELGKDTECLNVYGQNDFGYTSSELYLKLSLYRTVNTLLSFKNKSVNAV